MTKLEQVYRCPICGNMVSVLHAGAGTLVCCGKPMELLVEKTNEEGLNEKHVPVIEQDDDKIIVRIGSIPHPMEAAHYIEWIELIADGRSYLEFLQSGDWPAAEFCVSAKEISARAYCNVHGLWKKS